MGEGAGPEVAGRLKEAGLRVTRGRQAVHQVLSVLGGHRSADEVHEALLEAGHRLSRTSVYSTLDTLTRIGLLMAADAGPGRALYEANAKWHHHAVCRACGEVTDVDCAIGAKPCLEVSGDWGDVDEAQVIFRGTCSRCLEKKRSRWGPGPAEAERRTSGDKNRRERDADDW